MPLIASSGQASQGPTLTAPKGPKPPKPPQPPAGGNQSLQAAAGNASSGGGTATLYGQQFHAPAAPDQYGNGTPGSTPSNGGGAPGSSLDGTALANIAAYLNKTGNTIANDNADITNYQTGLANAIAQYKQANQMANLRLMTGDNASGGLYGSAYGQQLGNQNTAYGDKETAATNTTNLNIGKLQNEIAALQSSEPIEAAQEAAASTQRATAAAAKSAPAPVTPTPAAKGATSSQRPNLQPQKNTNSKPQPTRMGGFR